ncbi:hypothetical protein ACOME3_009810 [Neoechinorhynchus agilis]
MSVNGPSGGGHRNSGAALIESIRQYMKYFFSCHQCYNHFEIYADRYAPSVQDLDDGILFLWQVHNVLNRKLIDKSKNMSFYEDPLYPKRIFPTELECPNCRSAHKVTDSDPMDMSYWNRDEVLRFLRKVYSVENIDFREEPYAEDRDNIRTSEWLERMDRNRHMKRVLNAEKVAQNAADQGKAFSFWTLTISILITVVQT